MKLEKIQIEALKRLMDDQTAVAYDHDVETGDCFLCHNRAVVYRIPADRLRLALGESMLDKSFSDSFDEAETSSLYHLEGTDSYRKQGRARKYLVAGDPSKPVYIYTPFLACFENPELYQLEEEEPFRSLVFVKEQDQIVGAVLPVIIKD